MNIEIRELEEGAYSVIISSGRWSPRRKKYAAKNSFEARLTVAHYVPAPNFIHALEEKDNCPVCREAKNQKLDPCALLI